MSSGGGGTGGSEGWSGNLWVSGVNVGPFMPSHSHRQLMQGQQCHQEPLGEVTELCWSHRRNILGH